MELNSKVHKAIRKIVDLRAYKIITVFVVLVTVAVIVAVSTGGAVIHRL